MSTLHDVATAMDKEKEAEKNVADFGGDVTTPADLGWRLKEPEGISPHVQQTRRRFLEVRQGVVKKLEQPRGDVPNTEDVDVATLAEDVVATLSNKTLDLVEGVTDRTIATSQGVALAGAMATQRAINEIKDARTPSLVSTLKIPPENIGKVSSSTDTLRKLLQQEQAANPFSSQPELTKAILTYSDDKSDRSIDIKKFGSTPSIPATSTSEKVPSEEVALNPEVNQGQESATKIELLKQKESLLRAKKELLQENISKNTKSLESLRATEGAISALLDKESELSDESKENTLNAIREKIRSVEADIARDQTDLTKAQEDHTVAVAELAAMETPLNTVAPEAPVTVTTPNPTTPLFNREGLTDFEKTIAEQKTVADLFTLLASEKYKNYQFGSGTRKESGVQLAQRISENILQAKVGGKVSPRFFIPDPIVAERLQELLETSPSWRKRDREVGDYSIDVFEKIESDNSINDEQVGKAAKETIAKVQRETQPGLFEGVQSWFKRTDTIFDKTVEVGLRHSKKVGFFAGLLLALGLWSASGDKNSKEGTESVNPDTISESREEEPFLGTNPAYNDGSSSQMSQDQKEQAEKAAAADAVKNAYADAGIHPDKVDLGGQDTKVFTGEEVVSPDGQDTVVDTKPPQKENLWGRIGNPMGGMSDFRIEDGNVYTIDPRQVRYVEAPTQKTYWAQAVVNDALNYNIESRDGSIDVGKVNQWAKHHLSRVFDMYEKQNTEMKATGASYTDAELIFLRNTFVQLQKKITEVGQKTNTLSPELNKVALAIQGIDLVLGSQQQN